MDCSCVAGHGRIVDGGRRGVDIVEEVWLFLFPGLFGGTFYRSVDLTR